MFRKCAFKAFASSIQHDGRWNRKGSESGIYVQSITCTSSIGSHRDAVASSSTILSGSSHARHVMIRWTLSAHLW